MYVVPCCGLRWIKKQKILAHVNSCAVQRNLPPLAPLHSWPWATHPMQHIHIDFVTINQCKVLMIMDAHSKWIDAAPLQSATATTTINTLRWFFASFGLPEELLSDDSGQNSFVQIIYIDITLTTPPLTEQWKEWYH